MSKVSGKDKVANDDDPISADLVALSDDAVAPATVPEVSGEEGKLKVILGLLKKLMGVKDVANLRLSLPASLLEPIPNLEYWTYCDRADLFAAVGDSHDELERMLAVLRFAFSKELKFIRSRLGKPYNSALGEHFRCHWRLPPAQVDPQTKTPIIRTHIHVPTPGAPEYGGGGSSGFVTPKYAGSINGDSDADASSVRSLPSSVKRPQNKSAKNSFEGATESMAGLNVTDDEDGGYPEHEKVTVVFLCEQVSHHPPISAAYYGCPERGVEMYGMDQISAKVSGMAVRVAPGPEAKGIFVKITRDGPGKGEEYQIIQPAAQVNGILKGTYYGTISDQVSVTCRGTDDKAPRLKALIDYKDESWLGRPRFLLEGVIFRYDPGNETHMSWTKCKQVPSDRVVATFEGNWMKQIKYKLKGEKESRVLIDFDQLALIPKAVRPLEEQDHNESRKLWDPVTENLLAKNWGEATRQKQVIEQRQRDIAAEKKKNGQEHQSAFFEADWSDGRPKLSPAGVKAVEDEVARSRRGQ